jgi:predicted MFS family arabinose efflux permease
MSCVFIQVYYQGESNNLSGFVLNGGMFLLPSYYQQVREESIIFAGLSLIPQGVGMLLSRSWAGKLFDRIGARVVVIASLAVTMVDTVPFVFANANTNQILLIVALLIRGAGLGGLLIPIMSSAYIGLAKNQVPDASITTKIFQTVGDAFGSATLVTIVQQQLSGSTTSNTQTVASAYNVTFLWTIAFAAISIIPGILLPKHNTNL